ncbi:hypothetical protein SAMN05444000_102269 [Shimia gijangensis]|uniref:Uncharacterized protein n=1 Tax=Shimia gijangensis TaxID=1470563 RepID=A0A1M6DA39_9RHOB|nr:DUF3604 domain-containing protein [Shimia gijangensis]SHI70122.1 hypothetical protein SAMN05444000_102269 [Shimia gijangensis]
MIRDMHACEKRRTAWDDNFEAAELHNDPGVFTAIKA